MSANTSDEGLKFFMNDLRHAIRCYGTQAAVAKLAKVSPQFVHTFCTVGANQAGTCSTSFVTSVSSFTGRNGNDPNHNRDGSDG